MKNFKQYLEMVQNSGEDDYEKILNAPEGISNGIYKDIDSMGGIIAFDVTIYKNINIEKLIDKYINSEPVTKDNFFPFPLEDEKDNLPDDIPNPKDWWELKKILKFDSKYDKAVTELELKSISFEQSLRINNWTNPSDTITATGPEIHPNKTRRMSVRECAIIQTFPDDFIFKGSLGNMYKQIGNAVPVLLANKIALELKKELKKNKKK